LLNICRFVFGINLVELLKGRTVLPDSEIAHHRLNLAVSPGGKSNWALMSAQPSTGKPKFPLSSAGASTKDAQLTVICAAAPC
jgi:hypothetical protein